MATNCNSCKWFRIKQAGKDAMKRLKVTDADIAQHCAECLEGFRDSCISQKKVRTCFGCEWKDRTLPYEARRSRCKICVETFVAKTDHNCTKCAWNDPKRRMPTDASLAHCKACLAAVAAGGSMNCETCEWSKMPEQTRRHHCMTCSIKFASNSKVRGSINELSNKGQTIVSYDNHNPNMTDDRDTVTKISREYTEARKSRSGEGYDHPVHAMAYNADMGSAEYAEQSYDHMKRFLYEICQLTDMQALLFLSEVKGEQKTDFAKNHNMTDSAVNSLFKQILYRSPIFRDFIILSRGSLRGTRGRKSKSGNLMANVPKKTKKIVYAGMFQPTLIF